jgi:hypothetical protein
LGDLAMVLLEPLSKDSFLGGDFFLSILNGIYAVCYGTGWQLKVQESPELKK